jgi:hypothetical protein
MSCPKGDGELIEKIVNRPGDTSLKYLQCNACGGQWLRAFDANFLKPDDISHKIPSGQPLLRPFVDFSAPSNPSYPSDPSDPSVSICPVCGFKLARATGPNIPENVISWQCPHGHGYFFPQGQLFKFKVAQEAKIAYHKAWNIPIAGVSSTLLTAIIGIILSLGLIFGAIEGQRQQIILTQAKDNITYNHVSISKDYKSITFMVNTAVETTITLHINQLQFISPMQSADKKSHVLRITNVPSGEYNYYLTFPVNGKEVRSENYSFKVE